VQFKYLTILSTYNGFNCTCNVSMSSLKQAGTQDKMSTKVLRPLCFKVVVRGLDLTQMKNHFHLWWLAK